MRPARCIVALVLVLSVMIAVAAGNVVSADDEEVLRSNEEEDDEEDEDGRTRRSTSDSLLGMEFDDETGEELLRSYVPADNSVVDLQKLGGAGDTVPGADTTIVLMGDQHSLAKQPQIFYQVGSSEEELPECLDGSEVCSKVDLYGDPWVERQCRCSEGRTCSHSLHADDGHTIIDKTRQYKICEPIKRLPICRYFKDVSWTIRPGSGPQNTTRQHINCRCRPGSVAYLMKRQQYTTPTGVPGYVYFFACSPQSRMRCQPKEPCRLFTVHKKSRSHLEEVNASPLCQCTRGHRCPRRHTDPGTIPASYYGALSGVKVFSGHCVPTRQHQEPVYTIVQ